MTRHLGDWVSPLADGQLGPQDTERALAHVAACAVCAAELETARAARRHLAGARDVAAAPDLTERLLALSATIPSAQGDPLRAPERDTTWSSPEAWQPTLTGDVAAAARRRRRRRVALVGVGGAGVVGCALFVLGQAPVVSPDPSRAAALTTLASDASTGTATVSGLDAAGFVAPSQLPAGYEVAAVRTADDVVEIDLTGPDGPVVVRELRGRLGDVGDAHLAVEGRDGPVVLTRDPWHVAWQSGDVVVEVTTDVPQDVLVDVVAAFPDRAYDAGVLPRITRGWSTVTGALAHP
ncbi:zf-HC2 domain-containing protein [Isoptericola aurantiacus]|uniref:zf-HC2 domain-containing protein n=1 Tax=Isoptericola aurantiacus TaxID=3377839 RepID=UPI003839F618